MNRRLTSIMAAFGMVVAILGGCGSDAKDSAKPATTPVTQPPPTQPPPTDTTGVPTDFRTTKFVPAFSVHLPGGWVVAERDVDLAQLYQECSSCEHGGEENGEISIARELASLAPAKAAAHLAANQTGKAGVVEAAEVASYAGTHISISRPGTARLWFTEGGYHTEGTGDPVDVYFLDVGGKTMDVIVDSHTAAGTAATAFHRTASQILESLKFAS